MSVAVSETELTVRLEDGRAISVPTAWFPLLAQANETQRSNWKLIGHGIGIHWPDLDEDISVANLLGTGSDLLIGRMPGPTPGLRREVEDALAGEAHETPSPPPGFRVRRVNRPRTDPAS